MTTRKHVFYGILALVTLLGLGITQSARANYTVNLKEVGSNVVATGSGTIDLTGLSFSFAGGNDPQITGFSAFILTGSGTANFDAYTGITGPTSFGSGLGAIASSVSGNAVGVAGLTNRIFVPQGYISGNPLSSTATWDNATFASLGVTPGTYVWTWGSGQSFTLQIGEKANYTVNLEEVGSNVVATGSGTIDLTGLSFSFAGGNDPQITGFSAFILTGSGTANFDAYTGITGPTSFGSGLGAIASSVSGNAVGVAGLTNRIFVPQGYISGNPLSSTATWDNATFASLGVTPGTYVWTWGSGQSFTLQIGGATLPPCPQPQGYWKNNPDAWPVESLMLGSQTYTKAELLTILGTPTGKGTKADASLILADQLIAAKLNIENGADGTPVTSTIADADAVLSLYSGKLQYRVRTNTTNGKRMVNDAATLQSYNNGVLTAGCGG